MDFNAKPRGIEQQTSRAFKKLEEQPVLETITEAEGVALLKDTNMEQVAETLDEIHEKRSWKDFFKGDEDDG